MHLKAMLVCDDVRFELGGTMTLIGVHGERLIAPAGDGVVRFPKLMFVAIVGGLEGVERVGYRQRMREASELELGGGQMVYEPHDPQAGEHTFVFGDAPIVFPGVGSYEVVMNVEADGQRASYALRFRVERAATTT